MLEGTIVKGIGGFYYVEAAGAVYECRARGIFRRQKLAPLAGDRVCFTVRDGAENTIDEILPRHNEFRRPPLANLDQLLLVSSVSGPAPNTLLLDKLIAIAESKQIEPMVVITKTDLGDPEEMLSIYRTAGITACAVSCRTGEGVEIVREWLPGKATAFTGNSGVGKSSLLNAIDARLGLPTGEISDKLGRGRHTTRQVELFHVAEGFVADTPGFSSLDLERTETIDKETLPTCFREFIPYLGTCQFSTCTHVRDKGCRIVEAVESGAIHPSRHASYVALYEQVKEIKEWETR